MSNAEFNMSLLDRDLDSIEDLAGFETPQNGMYTLLFNTELKVVNDKQCVSANFEVVECMEQDDPDAVPTKPKTKFNVLYFIENDIALSALKELLKPVSAHFGVNGLATLVTETCKDSLTVAAKVRRRKNREEPDRPFAQVSNLVIM